MKGSRHHKQAGNARGLIMKPRHSLFGRLGVAVVSSALLASMTACSGGGDGASKSGEMEIPVLYVSGETGGVGKVVVGVSESDDGAVRVDFSEDEVEGLGPMTRASLWNVAAVSILLSGESPTKSFSFAVKGRVDGPSAGAVTTVGALALMRGEKLLEKTAMTGTIQPDGSVGPVGGVPEKVRGASENGYTKVGIPIGLRNATSAATGESVDVISLGRELGVEVVEVANVYEAYQLMTGNELPRLTSTGSVKLSDTSYERLSAKTALMLANYEESLRDTARLTDFAQSLLGSLLTQATSEAERANELKQQGLVAGAFTSAIAAWGYARAIAATGEVLDSFVFDSTDSAISRINDSNVVNDKVIALMDNLKTFSPKSPSDATALMTAFANAIDALSLTTFAADKINLVKDRYAAGEITKDGAVSELIVPLLYNEFAAVQVDATKELFDAGRDLGSTEISVDVNVGNIADLLRKGADANLAAFETQVVDDIAERYNKSSSFVAGIIADNDLDVALAREQQKAIATISSYLGEKSPARVYAVLGYGVNNYSRTAQILTKYVSNGVIDDNFTITGVQSEAALSSSLDLGKNQLAANIELLRSKSIEPSNEVGLFEAASLDREGDVEEKISALGKYWSGYLGARVLAYLGGIEREGLAD